MSADEEMVKLILMMESLLGRIPTEDEVYNFIYGDEATRAKILAGEFNN